MTYSHETTKTDISAADAHPNSGNRQLSADPEGISWFSFVGSYHSRCVRWLGSPDAICTGFFVKKITKTGHLPLPESFNFGNFNIRDTLWTNVDRHPSTTSPSSAPYIDASRFAFLPDQNLQLQTMWVCVLEKNWFWACYFVKSWYILKQTMGVLG